LCNNLITRAAIINKQVNDKKLPRIKRDKIVRPKCHALVYFKDLKADT